MHSRRPRQHFLADVVFLWCGLCCCCCYCCHAGTLDACAEPARCDPYYYLDDSGPVAANWTCKVCPVGADCTPVRHGTTHRRSELRPLPGYYRMSWSVQPGDTSTRSGQVAFGKCPVPRSCPGGRQQKSLPLPRQQTHESLPANNNNNSDRDTNTTNSIDSNHSRSPSPGPATDEVLLAETEVLGDALCAEGHDSLRGEMCTQCLPGWANDHSLTLRDRRCTQCPEGGWTSMGVLLIGGKIPIAHVCLLTRPTVGKILTHGMRAPFGLYVLCIPLPPHRLSYAIQYSSSCRCGCASQKPP